MSKPFSSETVLVASVSVWSIVKSLLADVMKKLDPLPGIYRWGASHDLGLGKKDAGHG